MNNTKKAAKSKQTINVSVVEATQRKGRKSKRSRKTKDGGALMLHSPQGGAYNTFVPMTSFVTKAGSTPGGMRVSGRVLVSTLTSPGTGFSVLVSFGLNPTVIPRLSSFAPAFEQYFFHKTRIMFQSSQPTTAGGVVMLAVDYDSKDTNPTSTITMMRNASSSMSNVYANNSTFADPEYARLKRFNVSEDAATDADQVNQGDVIFACEGVAAGVVGYCLVEFDCEFFIPQ